MEAWFRFIHIWSMMMIIDMFILHLKLAKRLILCKAAAHCSKHGFVIYLFFLNAGELWIAVLKAGNTPNGR